MPLGSSRTEPIRETVRTCASATRPDRREPLLAGHLRVHRASPHIDGVEFAEAWPGRVEVVLVTTDGDVPMSFIGLAALAKNKRATGRPKDLDDLSYLTRET